MQTGFTKARGFGDISTTSQTFQMKRIPLTQGKFALVDNEDYDEFAKHTWRVTNSGYACRTLKHPVSVYMHKVILGAKPNEQGDHINGDRLDNRRRNLRLATNQQNLCNRGKQRNNTSGFKGVYWHKSCQKWGASIKLNGTKIHLGLFDGKEIAHAAYCGAAKMYHGEFWHV